MITVADFAVCAANDWRFPEREGKRIPLAVFRYMATERALGNVVITHLVVLGGVEPAVKHL